MGILSSYKSITIQPQQYHDDLIKGSTSINVAVPQMFRMQEFYIYLVISESCLIPQLQYLSYEGKQCYSLLYVALANMSKYLKSRYWSVQNTGNLHYRRSDESPLITMGPIKQLRNAKHEHSSLNYLPFDEEFQCKTSHNPKLIQSPISNASSPGTSRKSFHCKVNKYLFNI